MEQEFFFPHRNFLPHLPISGFDHYVIGLPFGFKSVVSFLLIINIATFPFCYGKSKYYDFLYIFIAIFASSFLLLSAFDAFRNILAGIDLEQIYKLANDAKYHNNSIFFSFHKRLAVLMLMAIYVFWSLRLVAITWKEIGLILLAIIAGALVRFPQ